MNKLIIYEYINKLRYEDMVNYCNYKGINVDELELNYIYNYVKNNYKKFFNNPMECLNEVKANVSEYTFNEIITLYDKYGKYI